MTEHPQLTPDHILRGVSLSRRVGLTVAGLGGLLGAGLLGLLWATEPTPLPGRTQAAFAAMIVVGLTWAGLAAWTLVRRPLFAIDRVVTASLALIFSLLSTVWMARLAWNRSGVVGLLTVAGVGLTLTLVSATLLRRARAYRATLLQRRRRLEQDTEHDTEHDTEQDTATPQAGRMPLPIGPLALALRLRRTGPATRTVAVLALVLTAAFLAGLVLLVR